MSTAIKVLAWVSKAVGLASALDWTGIAPSHGLVIFLVGSLVKDSVNRVGDYLDNKQLDGSFKP
ncbi:MAG: hypothetical protein MUF81_14545 [Verrucomicrobia bacterium]|jgi:hypothetical protein|nr:hypothetical protein [Verrucomicrobiota bacterium]